MIHKWIRPESGWYLYVGDGVPSHIHVSLDANGATIKSGYVYGITIQDEQAGTCKCLSVQHGSRRIRSRWTVEHAKQNAERWIEETYGPHTKTGRITFFLD